MEEMAGEGIEKSGDLILFEVIKRFINCFFFIGYGKLEVYQKKSYLEYFGWVDFVVFFIGISLYAELLFSWCWWIFGGDF
jgi:hypothetical protein